MRATKHAAPQPWRRRGLVTRRITDIYGERLTVEGIAVRPDVAQPTGVQFALH
ncbi:MULTISPECIES: hypothetical protein [unclassified Streptomyces]|uniref:hypothetical protein n=1 Tax=unclassified Streptomyces TaxID=2593676 RepID=UPI003008132A